MSVDIDVKPQSAVLKVDQASINYTTQARKIYSMSNGGWQWGIQASYRALTQEKWTVLQSNLLKAYGTHGLMKFYLDYLYPNATGFAESTPIEFEVSSTRPAGSRTITLSNVNNISLTSKFKTGDVLYHPNLGPGNINIVAADAQVTTTLVTVYLVRPIRAQISAGDTIGLADYMWVGLANKDWNVTRNTSGYYDIDVEFVVRDKFRNYQNG